MKKYAALEDLIVQEFRSLSNFSRAAGIPKTTLSRLISGKHGNDEGQVRKRVETKIKELKPGSKSDRIWDVTHEFALQHTADMSKFKHGFKIIADVKIDENGMTISPIVKGY